MTWQWTMDFNNPSTGASVVLTNPTVIADHYLIYAGARESRRPYVWASADRAAIAGEHASGSVHPSDQSQVNQITSDFQNAVEVRGENSGFARWGGTIAFDTVPSSPWHFNHSTAPAGGSTDFYSVAIHELAHSLGFGQGGTSAWNAHVNDATFTFIGPYAMAQNGGNSVPLSGDLSHWAIGTNSVIYGGSTAQEAAMDPDLLNGTRKYLTALDAAALKDIGWELTTPPGVPGDYNNNGKVDAADYVLWRNGGPLANEVNAPGTVNAADYTAWRARFGNTSGSGGGAIVLGGAVPEPTGAVLVLLGGAAAACFFRRCRGVEAAL